MAPSAPVLLVFPPWAPNVEHPESGPAYLKAALQQRGHQAVVLDLNVQFLAAHPEARRHRPEFRHAEGPLQPHPLQPPTLQLDHVAAYVDEQRGPWQEVSLPALLQQLPPGRPIVGFSIFSPTQLPVALQLARGAREARPGARIVLGGPWCAAAIDRLPRVLQRYPFVDGAVPYDGETPLCNLAEGDPDASLDELPGFVTARASLAAGVPSSVPMTEQSAPDYADLPLGLYPHATLPLRTRRGCTWGRCVFCVELHPDDRRSSEPMPAALAAEQMGELVGRYGIGHVTLANHVTPPDELEALAEALIASRGSLKWTSLCRFDRRLTLPLLRRLAQAGCRSLQLGLEAINSDDLATLRKGTARSVVERNLADCQRAGMRVDVTAMAFPGQSPGGFADTLAFLLEHARQVSSVTVLRFALPCTSAAFRQPELLGITAAAADDDLDVFNLPYSATTGLSVAEFRRLVDRFEAELRAQQNVARGAAEQPDD